MRRFSVLAVALLVGVALFGQSGPDVLRSVSEKMASMESYRIEFELEMEAAENPSKGYCVVVGESYVIAIDELVQGCDGQVQWMVNGAVGEVTLDSPKPRSRSLFDNPTRAFDFAEELFEVVDFDDSVEGVWKLVLRPAEGVLDGIEYVVLNVNRATSLPVKLGYDMGGLGLYINIQSVTPTEVTGEEFRFVPESYPDYEIIDFR